MADPNNRITVIVPVYNVERYINKCIDSIKNQTYSNLQIILVDDGSTDNSGKICDIYAMNDNRIEVFHTKNKGLVAARKFGILHAVGEYVGFVDSDDYIEPNMYELLIKEAIDSEADFVHMGYIEETGRKSKVISGFKDELLILSNIRSKENILIKYILCTTEERYISCSIWSKLFKKELIHKCYLSLPDEQQYGEDLLCLCLCILECKTLKLSDNALYHYRIQERSLSHMCIEDHAIEVTKLNYNILKLFQEYNEKIYNRLKKNIVFYLKKSYIHLSEILTKEELHISYFYWKNLSILRGKKIIIYGAGKVGQDYYLQFCRYKDIEIVGWIDSNLNQYIFDYAVISDRSILIEKFFEKVVIAVKNKKIAKEIENILLEYEIDKEKILWEAPGNVLEENQFF